MKTILNRESPHGDLVVVVNDAGELEATLAGVAIGTTIGPHPYPSRNRYGQIDHILGGAGPVVRVAERNHTYASKAMQALHLAVKEREAKLSTACRAADAAASAAQFRAMKRRAKAAEIERFGKELDKLEQFVNDDQAEDLERLAVRLRAVKLRGDLAALVVQRDKEDEAEPERFAREKAELEELTAECSRLTVEHRQLIADRDAAQARAADARAAWQASQAQVGITEDEQRAIAAG